MSNITPYWNNESVSLYSCSANEFLEIVKPGGLLLTDPPYGLGRKWRRKWHGANGTSRLWTGDEPEWDKQTQWSTLRKALDLCDDAIVWGGNFYPLPPSRCWLIWDKKQDNFAADCEMAWTNIEMGTRVFRMSRIDAYYNKAIFKKQHPAEKPYQLGEWCLRFSSNNFVIDPWCGTGNFIVSAYRGGRNVMACDFNTSYLDEVIRRIEVT